MPRTHGLIQEEVDDLNRRFSFSYKALKDGALDLGLVVLRNAPPSRERSLALTKLEESVMWANAAIARNE